MILGFCFGFVVASLCWQQALLWLKRKKDAEQFKWTCPVEGCDFAVQSNAMEWTDGLASGHERTHNE